jgi:AMMECR1 domain-containing protein
VAPAQGWGLEDTLAHLSAKAGLPRDGWREGARFEIFEATVFAEHER